MCGHLFTTASEKPYWSYLQNSFPTTIKLYNDRTKFFLGIYDTLKTCALISKNAGGIGLNVHNIRSRGSYIGGTNGYSNGLIPMLRVYNNTAR